MTKRRLHAEPRRPWSAADDALVRERYPVASAAEIAAELGRPEHCVYTRARKLGLKKSREWIARRARLRMMDPGHPGRRTQFPKGTVPPNKGRRLDGPALERLRPTQFRKGQESWNHRPVGATRMIDGYQWTKVGAEPRVCWTRNWRQSHLLLWEAANGPVPDGHRIVFRNGERSDLRLENLECVSMADLARRNQSNYPEELRRVNYLRGALTRAINRRARREE